MSQTSNLVTYLPLPDALETAVKAAITEISATVNSHSGPWASNFDLPDNRSLNMVVDEAKKAYEKEKFPSRPIVLSSLGAVFRGTWKSGEQNDTVIVPLIENHFDVTATNPAGKEIKLDWHWKNAVFVPALTTFTIEGGHKIGAVIIQFKR